ncbi:MAG: hypothetical protein WDZ85_03890 [Candidatus Paceibacterota bacterium]
MKMLVTLVLVSMFVFGGAFADFLVNSQGEVKENEGWRPLTEFEQEAVNNPGTEVPIIDSQVKLDYRRDGFWHLFPIRAYEQVVVYGGG